MIIAKRRKNEKTFLNGLLGSLPKFRRLLQFQSHLCGANSHYFHMLLDHSPAFHVPGFLRHLLLRIMPDDWPIRSPGVRIHGARIEETLDLSDSVGLPGLALEDCELAASLDLTNARLARLSLHNSRIGEIRARGFRVEGSLELSGVAPRG